jgi:hypothetical protein
MEVSGQLHAPAALFPGKEYENVSPPADSYSVLNSLSSYFC